MRLERSVQATEQKSGRIPAGRGSGGRGGKAREWRRVTLLCLRYQKQERAIEGSLTPADGAPEHRAVLFRIRDTTMLGRGIPSARPWAGIWLYQIGRAHV